MLKIKQSKRKQKLGHHNNNNDTNILDDNQDKIDHQQQQQQKQKQQRLVIPLPNVVDGTLEKEQLPLLLRNRIPGVNEIDNEKERLKTDLKHRPDEDMEQYNKVQIEDFGAAMLRGMGYDETKQDKTNNKPYSVQVRPQRLGLGALPKPPPANDVSQKSKDKNKPTWLCNQAVVHITGGAHANQYAVIKQADGVPGLNNIIVQLDPGEDINLLNNLPEVILKRDLVKLVDHYSLPPTHPANKLLELSNKMFKKTIVSRKRPSTTTTSSSSNSENKKIKVDSTSSSSSSSSKSNHNNTIKKCWLIPGIRVRVVSKKIGKNGEFYTKKGIVQDILDPIKSTCLLSIDNRIVENVPQKYLDTALPKRDGTVIVVDGKHHNEKGKLLERNSAKDCVKVQLFDDMNVYQFRFDQVAEYCL